MRREKLVLTARCESGWFYTWSLFGRGYCAHRWGYSLLSYPVWWEHKLCPTREIRERLLGWSGHQGWCVDGVSVSLFEEVPSVRYNNEHFILWKLWWVDHDTVIKETCHLSGTEKWGIRLEMGFTFINQFLIEQWPGFQMDGEDNEDLKRVEALKGSLTWIPRGKVGWELYKCTTFQLGVL